MAAIKFSEVFKAMKIVHQWSEENDEFWPKRTKPKTRLEKTAHKLQKAKTEYYKLAGEYVRLWMQELKKKTQKENTKVKSSNLISLKAQ